MFCVKPPKFARSLALRLTLWYAAIFAISSILAFAFAYVLTAALIAQRTDADMQEDISDLAKLFEQEGVEFVKREIVLDTQGKDAERFFFRLWTSDGRQLSASDLAAWPGLAPVPASALRAMDRGIEPELVTLKLPAREDRVRILVGRIGPGVALDMGRSLEDDDALVAQMLHGFPLALAAVLLLAGPIGWFMARRALRGVEQVTRTANDIIAGALDRRVPVGSQGDELDALARTFNTMLDRIQSLITGMRDMADNLAHDLRGPLARIRAAAEISLSSDHSNSAREGLAANTIEECDRLLELVNTTLDIAEADSGAAKLNLSSVDLGETVLDACELFQPVAEDKSVNLVSDVPAACRIEGDRHRLQRVIANLLDNAIKYTRAGGRINVALREHGGEARVTVTDTGVGMPAEELSRIFQRFYRCDQSRSQYGTGLGLSLALAFARAHGGNITVASTPGLGSTFCLTLPRAPHRLPSQATKPEGVQTSSETAGGAAMA
jgi:heavy metal sensor kinase